MKIRDLLAVPFWALALLLDKAALMIGGVWTAEVFLEGLKKQYEKLVN